LAAVAAVFLSVVGCTLPIQQGGKSGNNKNVALVSPVASPTPTPALTQVFAASAPAFHIGEVGVGYAPVAITATGGVLPYHWSVTNGAVPLGLSVGDDGTLAGVPTSPGKYDFTVHVADSGDSKATMAGSITIADRLNASLIPSCAKYCTVELGCVNACGNFGAQTGGVGPFTYSLTQGQVPSGTSLSGLSLKATFGGLTGYLQFTVQVTDTLGATDTVSPTFWMYAHVALSNGTCYSTYYPFPCSATIPFSGGTPNTSFSGATVSATCQMCRRALTGGWACSPTSSPPPLFSASVGNGVVNVTVPGQPNNPFEYSGIVTLRLTDQDSCGSGVRCSTTATVQVTFAGG